MELVPSNAIEPILFKMFCSDPKYCTILAPHFERQWFNDSDLGLISELVLKYFGKYTKLPKYSTVELIIQKQFSDRSSEVLSKVRSAYEINSEKYDRDYLDDEIMKYLRNGGIYWTIMSNVDEIAKSHSVKPMLDKLQFLTSMSFDVDIGLDYIEEINQHCADIMEDELRLPTYWDSMDHVMNGGMYVDGRCLAVFLGQTHVGKSLILSNMAAQAIQHGKFALIITMEMAEKVYATRVDAHITGENINKLKHHTDKLKDCVEYIKADQPEAKLIIKEFPPDTISCSHIKNYIDKIIGVYNRKPDVILIDYINLLVPEGSQQDGTYNKYRTVATEMRRLSYIFNRPVVSVTQMNRGGFGSADPGLDDTSDSMGIPMVADFVGGIYQNDGDRNAGIINIAVLKNRLGGMIGKKLQFTIDYENLKITDVKSRSQAPEDLVSSVLSEIGVDDL